MASKTVQFYGLDSVIKAAENRDCPTWGLFTAQDRQFLFKCENATMEQSILMLTKTLELLEGNETTAIYTLKFYEGADNGKVPRIKENTPCDGSFNFRLIDEDSVQETRNLHRVSGTRSISRLDDLEKKFDELMEVLKHDADDDEESQETMQQAFIGLIKEPAKLHQLINGINAARAMLTGGNPQLMGAVGNVIPMGQTTVPEDPGAGRSPANLSQAPPEYDDQDLLRLNNALNILGTHDPLIIDHLEKLSQVAQANTVKFKSLISMIDIL